MAAAGGALAHHTRLRRRRRQDRQFHDQATAHLAEWTPIRSEADDPVETDTSAGRIVMRNRPVYDVVALLARCGVGTVFLAHGWQKIQVGVTTTAQNLDAMGTPAPTAAAVYSTFVELLGGAALILGLALPVAGTLLFLDMAGALIFLHAKHGIFLVDNGRVHNGFELALVLGLAALVFAAGGGGRLTLDHHLFGQNQAEREGTGNSQQTRVERARPGRDEKEAPSRRSMFHSRKRSVAPPTSDRAVPAGEFPAPPEADEKSSRPRLAAEMVTDTSRDMIVAGKKAEPSSDDTTPVRTRKKPPKSDS
jgi:putative oxidoreductase